MVIQLNDSLADQFVCLEINGVVSLMIDSAPKFLELLAFKFLRIKLRLAYLPAILRFDGIRIKDGFKFPFHIFLILIIFSKVERTFLLVLMILGCQLTIFGDIALHAKGKGQFLRIVL